MASSSDMSTPLMVMLIGSMVILIGSTGTGVVVLLEGFDMVAVEGDEFVGR